MLTGNKGEWSEVYAFLDILANGEIAPADANLNEITSIPAIPVIKVFRKEKNAPRINYYVGDLMHAGFDDGTEVARVEKGRIHKEAGALYRAITGSKERVFAIPATEEFMSELGIHKLKAPSTDKTDIHLQIHDMRTGFDIVCGWSIKSRLGSPSTLLNAGETTNFIYRLGHCDQALMNSVNAISSGKGKIKDRVAELQKNCEITFCRPANTTFGRNMRLIDSLFPQIMADAVLRYYLGEGTTCMQIVDAMEHDDVFGLGKGMYEFKFKKLLCASALGMDPSKEWSGRDNATGGYIVVREDGKVLAFHIYNRDMFEDYLFENTKFETASTGKYNFGSVYEQDGEYYIKLNLQIRFRK